MGAPILRVDHPSELPAAIVVCANAGAIGLAHLLRAVASGRIAMLSLMPETNGRTFKAFAKLAGRRPAIVFIGDDDYQDRGPSAWPQAGRAIRWSTRVVLHAAGAEISHYEAAVRAAEEGHHVVFVETNTTTVEQWIALATKPGSERPTLVILPQDGSHPLPVPPEAIQ